MSILDNVKNLNTMPEECLTEDRTRRMIVGEKQMLTVWRMKKGAHSLAHKHPEEQIFWILSGVYDCEVEGRRRRLLAGDTGVIPSNVMHEGWVIEDVEMVNIFSPLRNDFLGEGTRG